eukprot:TRINITY_DN1625_c1_g1_i5.p1 TRINITY_DN1625_c1_g1~~TRINITY_DN1625_c1_g1_i5.p1  ORF type:complete len:434 (+),score=39.69 TRINITY_DN1625_c1_g1_i5:148-1302(+)
MWPEPRIKVYFSEYPYSYHNVYMPANPPPILIRKIMETMQSIENRPINSLLVSLYRCGTDSINWHADDEKCLGPKPTILSLSLGATRLFKLRHNATQSVIKINLAHGDYMSMSGTTQVYWQHAISKETSSKQIGRRLNFTGRYVIPELAQLLTPPTLSLSTSQIRPIALVRNTDRSLVYAPTFYVQPDACWGQPSNIHPGASILDGGALWVLSIHRHPMRGIAYCSGDMPAESVKINSQAFYGDNVTKPFRGLLHHLDYLGEGCCTTQDHELGRGNRALYLSHHAKWPVRVVEAVEGTSWRYLYHGLYAVAEVYRKQNALGYIELHFVMQPWALWEQQQDTPSSMEGRMSRLRQARKQLSFELVAIPLRTQHTTHNAAQTRCNS